MKMKFDQDLCKNLWYDLKKLFWQDELNPRVRCIFSKVFNKIHTYKIILILKMKFDQDLCKNLWYDLNKLIW